MPELERDYELKLGCGCVVTWAGITPEGAFRRWADTAMGRNHVCGQAPTLVAWRIPDWHGLSIGLLPIVGPDGRPA